MTVFKIRHKKTGLFSKGGYWPVWSTRGKVWNSMGTLRQHLALYEESLNPRYWGAKPPDDDRCNWEVIPLTVESIEGAAIPVLDLDKVYPRKGRKK